MNYTDELRKLIRDFNNIKKAAHRRIFEINKGEGCVLLLLLESGEGLTPNEIIRETGYSSPHCAKILHNLVRKGQAERVSSQKDKRSAIYLLTEKGRVFIDSMKQEVTQGMDELFNTLGDNDSRELLRILGRIVEIEGGNQS